MHGRYLTSNGRVIWTNNYQLRANIGSLRLDVDSGGSDVEDLRLNINCLRIQAPSIRHEFCGSLSNIYLLRSSHAHLLSRQNGSDLRCHVSKKMSAASQ